MKTWLAYNWLKLLALLMVLGAIYQLSSDYYWYYQLMEWVVLGAVFVAVQQSHQHDRPVLMWILILMAVLFNPITPFYLKSGVWQILDVVAAIVFLASIVLLKSKK